LLAAIAAVSHAFKAAAPAPVPGISPSPSSSAQSCRLSMATSASKGGGADAAAAADVGERRATPISRIGFGTYRVGNSKEQAQAIREALLHGVTLIDTSANYGDGDSERTIGHVVRELVAEGRLRREDLVLVSKFGYIQVGVTLCRGRVLCMCVSVFVIGEKMTMCVRV
jgi:uncharacterized protein